MSVKICIKRNNNKLRVNNNICFICTSLPYRGMQGLCMIR